MEGNGQKYYSPNQKLVLDADDEEKSLLIS